MPMHPIASVRIDVMSCWINTSNGSIRLLYWTLVEMLRTEYPINFYKIGDFYTIQNFQIFILFSILIILTVKFYGL